MQSTLDMTHDQWLEERRKGLGGSDAAAILGMNPHKSPLAVYCDKLGLAPETEDSEAARQGRDLEQYVAERFCEATGKKVRRCNRILQHPDYPWMLANIDRDVVGEDAGMEAKTTSVYNKTDFDSGDIPPSFWWQCQHYMAVTGKARWYLPVLVLSKAFHPFEVARSEEHIAYLIEQERIFWFDHVLAGVPPLPSGLECDDDLVGLLPAANQPDDVVDLQEIEDNVTLLQTYKADYKALEKRIAEAQQSIAVRLSGAATGLTNRWKVTYKEQTKRTIDGERLRADLPDIAAKYTNTTTSRVMRVKEVKA